MQENAWKCLLENGDHFVSVSMCYAKSINKGIKYFLGGVDKIFHLSPKLTHIFQAKFPIILSKENICIWFNRKWQDYVYIQCEYKSTKQKIKHLLRKENKVKENKIS